MDLLTKIASMNIIEGTFPYFAILVAVTILGLRYYLKWFIHKKRTFYTGRTTGKIVDFKENEHDPGCFNPVVEFAISGKTFNFESSLGQFDRKYRGINGSDIVLVRYMPNDPTQADVENASLAKIEDFYLTAMLVIGLIASLLGVGLLLMNII